MNGTEVLRSWSFVNGFDPSVMSRRSIHGKWLICIDFNEIKIINNLVGDQLLVSVNDEWRPINLEGNSHTSTGIAF